MLRFRIATLVVALAYTAFALPALATGDETPLAVAQLAAPAPAAAPETGLGAWPIAAPARPFDRALSPEDVQTQAPTTENGTRLRATVDLTAAPTSLWDRIRQGFGVTDMATPLVQQQISWFANRPDFIKRTVERSSRYLYHIVEEVQKRGMPTEIALLPVIESAFNPVAYSRAHASGIWQFIPSTGKLYGLQQNFWYDGRRDVMAATNAALDYLQKLYEMFGSWDLALAAYNWGEGAVSRAIAHNTARGLPTDYQSLKMPAETRYYFPRLQAVKDIVANPAQYGITLDEIPNRPYFTTVTTSRHIDMRVAAKMADTPLEEFMSLNPGYSRPVIRADSEQTLLVPMEKADIFRANLENNNQPLVSWQAYQLKSGETLDKVAARHNVTVAYLRQVNSITPKRKIGAGTMVLVPTAASATPNLPDLPAPQITMVRAPKKSIKHVRGSVKQKSAAHKTTASASQRKIVVAHSSR
jgi:membrane-bound lytic murein transglycosylase D